MDSKVLFQNKYNMIFGDSSTTFFETIYTTILILYIYYNE